MKISEANVPTAHAVSYMKQLCRHWAHKFPVEFDDQQGRIELPQTLCVLKANPDHLHIRLKVEDAADPARMQQVLAEHVLRFGFREQLVFDWREVVSAT